MTVRELLQRIDSYELSEWMAYYSLEPFGQDRGDIGPAIVAATVANANRVPDTPPYDLKDFLPTFELEPEKDLQSPAWRQQLAIVELLNSAFGGEDLRSSNGNPR